MLGLHPREKVARLRRQLPHVGAYRVQFCDESRYLAVRGHASAAELEGAVFKASIVH